MRILPKRRSKRRAHAGRSYWQSYSDMMAALLLVFVLIMSSILLQSAQMYDEKLREQEAAQAEIDKQLALVAAQQKQLEEQAAVMQAQQEQLDQIIGVKAQIIDQLSDIFNGSNMSVSLDPATGSIMLDSSILFDFSMATLKPEGEAYLQEFLPLYFQVLLSEEVLPYVSEIIIEGHTDSSGSYLSNLSLSQDRALSVANYCIQVYGRDLSQAELEQMQQLIEATGRSWNDLIYYSDGTENSDASRRVEFKFRLKDDEMIDAMTDILNQKENSP